MIPRPITHLWVSLACAAALLALSWRFDTQGRPVEGLQWTAFTLVSGLGVLNLIAWVVRTQPEGEQPS